MSFLTISSFENTTIPTLSIDFNLSHACNKPLFPFLTYVLEDCNGSPLIIILPLSKRLKIKNNSSFVNSSASETKMREFLKLAPLKLEIGLNSIILLDINCLIIFSGSS